MLVGVGSCAAVSMAPAESARVGVGGAAAGNGRSESWHRAEGLPVGLWRHSIKALQQSVSRRKVSLSRRCSWPEGHEDVCPRASGLQGAYIASGRLKRTGNQKLYKRACAVQSGIWTIHGMPRWSGVERSRLQRLAWSNVTSAPVAPSRNDAGARTARAGPAGGARLNTTGDEDGTGNRGRCLRVECSVAVDLERRAPAVCSSTSGVRLLPLVGGFVRSVCRGRRIRWILGNWRQGQRRSLPC